MGEGEGEIRNVSSLIFNMPNNWNIPNKLEEKVRARDKNCVYCHVKMKTSGVSSKTRATWEHIDNNEKNISKENIALCCNSYNASKGAKRLATWFKSSYCLNKGINKKTVAIQIRRHIKDTG